MAFCFAGLVEIIIPASVEFLDERYFTKVGSLSSDRFESGSMLSRIGKWTFYETGFVEVVLPSSVKVFGEECFH
jgi:hypothetical protein